MILKKKLLSLVFGATLLFSGCAGDVYVEKTSETVSRGVDATGAALDVGDIPAAKHFNQGVQKVLPRAKKQIDIKPIVVDGVQYIIIPANLASATPVVEGSTDFNKLGTGVTINVSQAKTYVEKEAPKQAVTNKNNEDGLIQQNKDLKQALDDWHKSIFFKAYVFCQSAFWLTIAAAVGTFVLICVCPATLPVIGTVAGTIIRVAIQMIDGIVAGVSWVMSHLFKKPTT